jgi:hypothetical protein
MTDGEFYVRYYVGHKGKFGHEFLEFEFSSDGECLFYLASHVVSFKNKKLFTFFVLFVKLLYANNKK